MRISCVRELCGKCYLESVHNKSDIWSTDDPRETGLHCGIELNFNSPLIPQVITWLQGATTLEQLVVWDLHLCRDEGVIKSL